MLIGEFATTNGEMVALTPKCYYIYDPLQSKFGTKGVPHNCKLTIERYKAALYKNEETKVTIQSLTLKKRRMTRISTTKNALNTAFVKFYVDKDRITCNPLKEKGVYL